MNKRIFDAMVSQYGYRSSTGNIVTACDGIKCRIPKLTVKSSIYRDHAPSSDSPSSLYFFGSGKITFCGKNISHSGMMKVSKASAWGYEHLGNFPLPPGTYSIKIAYKQAKAVAKVGVSIRASDGTTLRELSNSAETGVLFTTFTLKPGDKGCNIYLYSNLSGSSVETECDFYEIMLVYGSYSSSTIPEYETPSAYYRISAPSLYAIDSVSDEWNVTSGQIIRRVQKVIVDGENVRADKVDNDGSLPRFRLGVGFSAGDGESDICSTHFTTDTSESRGNICLSGDDALPHVYLWDSSIKTIDAANAFFKEQASSGKPIIVLTRLKDPLLETIDPIYPIEPDGDFQIIPGGGDYYANVDATYVTHA